MQPQIWRTAGCLHLLLAVHLRKVALIPALIPLSLTSKSDHIGLADFCTLFLRLLEFLLVQPLLSGRSFATKYNLASAGPCTVDTYMVQSTALMGERTAAPEGTIQVGARPTFTVALWPTASCVRFNRRDCAGGLMPKSNFLGIRVCLQAGRCPGLLSSPLFTNTAKPPHKESECPQQTLLNR